MVEITERRSHARAPVILDLNVKSGDHFITTTTQNLSAKGLCCTLSHHIPLFTKMQICLMVPNPADSSHEETDAVTCDGVVVRVSKCHMEESTVYQTAIFFTDIDADSASKIQDYIDAHTEL